MKCKLCGCVFSQKIHNQKFCSLECQRKYFNDLRPKKPQTEKTCLNCGEKFTTNNKRKIFCCSNCCIKFKNNQIPRRGVIFTTCKNCEKEFQTSASKGGIFCSRSCCVKFFSHQRGNGKILHNNELRKISLTKEQINFIVGTVLGDSSLRCRKNASLIIGHSKNQEEYMNWKIEQVPFIFRSIPGRYEYKDKNLVLLKATSIAHPDLTNLYNEIYISGKKSINKTLLHNYIDARALAFWFQDDGYRYGIATNSFDLEENKTIQQFLHERFSIESNIQHHPERTTSFGRAKESYSIRFRREPFQTLADIIKPYIHPSLLYKLDGSSNLSC